MTPTTTFYKPKPPQLSDKHAAFLRYVRDFLKENQVAPSYDDMALASGYTRDSARRCIDCLIRKGYLKRGPGRGRNLIVTPEGAQEVVRRRFR